VTVVIDASVTVAALIDGGPIGRWADALLAEDDVAAPHLVLVESANALRRAAIAGDITGEVASLAHADLLRVRIALVDYEPFAGRVWELRATVTSYDAWYVAVAERIGAPLATLDRRLARAAGPRCEFILPGR